MKNDFKVVKILDNQNIIINGGKNDNINFDDIFEIVGNGLEIKDPDSGESLGFLDNVKETVSAIKVYDKMCVCSHISESPSLLEIATKTTELYKGGKYKKMLNVEIDDALSDENVDKTIRIGDKAKLKINLPAPTPKSTKN